MQVDIANLINELFIKDSDRIRCALVSYHYHTNDGLPIKRFYSLNEYHDTNDRRSFLSKISGGSISRKFPRLRNIYGEELSIKIWYNDDTVVLNNEQFNYSENSNLKEFWVRQSFGYIPDFLRNPIINRDITNEKLLKIDKIKSLLFDNQIVVLDIIESKSNPNYKTLYLAQIVDNIPSDNIPNEFALLGAGKCLMRTHHPAKPEKIEKLKIGDSINSFFNTDFDFEIQDSYMPFWNGQQERVFLNRNVFEPLFDINENGKKVYRHCVLKVRGKVNHHFIRVIPSSIFAKQKETYCNENNEFFDSDNTVSYDEFNGAYGFDDDTINDAFEGDPENYWNID